MTLSKRRAGLLARLHSRRTREREGLYLLEGARAVLEALAVGADVRFALRSTELATSEAARKASAALDDRDVEVVDVDADAFARAADTETPQGVLVVCAEPGWSLDALVEDEAGRPRVLLLDAIQDPGNAGTLVRAAAAFGLSGVVALDGTVDPWSSRTVRASAGAILRTRVVTAPWEEVQPWLDSLGMPLLAGEAGGEDVATVPDSLREGGWALAVGNEAAGVRPGLRRRAERGVSIPMPGPTESLNAGVAGAVLLYALTRARPAGRPGGNP